MCDYCCPWQLENALRFAFKVGIFGSGGGEKGTGRQEEEGSLPPLQLLLRLLIGGRTDIGVLPPHKYHRIRSAKERSIFVLLINTYTILNVDLDLRLAFIIYYIK